MTKLVISIANAIYSKKLKILTAITYFAIASFGSLVHATDSLFEKECNEACRLSLPDHSSLCRSLCQCTSSKILSRYNIQQLEQLEQMSSDQNLITTLIFPEIESCIKPHLN